ncbi:MAG: hypothetical protein JO110_07050 [Acetobacteraceae bacterium]|nr:hypothetical protein [Acetobacteraceae bacterium]
MDRASLGSVHLIDNMKDRHVPFAQVFLNLRLHIRPYGLLLSQLGEPQEGTVASRLIGSKCKVRFVEAAWKVGVIRHGAMIAPGGYNRELDS